MTSYLPATFPEYTAQLREAISRAAGAAPFTEEEFDTPARALFKLQFDHNAPYRRFCQSRKAAPENLEHWSRIPTMPAAGFKEFELTCLPPAQRTRVFHSSGTTEQRPSRHFHNADSLALYEASLLPWFVAHLLPQPLAREISFLFLTPPPANAPHSSLVYMFETIRREFGAAESCFTGAIGSDGAWTLDLPRTLALLRESSAKNCPVMLPGTAFNFIHLLDGLRETGTRLNLPAGSRVMETGGYKGRSRTLPKPELHQLITDLLGIPSANIVCEYGMSELSSQAYDSVVTAKTTSNTEHRTPNTESSVIRRSVFDVQRSMFPAPNSRVFHFPPWARAQIISPETGREVAEGGTGLIRIFDLANVQSVMAIQTEDLGVRRGGGFELLGRAELSEPRGCSLQSS